jgi:subtilisin-like proprotein convertase family protein
MLLLTMGMSLASSVLGQGFPLVPTADTPVTLVDVDLCTPDDATAIDPGERVTMTFKFQNKTGAQIENMKVLLVSDPATGVVRARPGGATGLVGDAWSPAEGPVISVDEVFTATFTFVAVGSPGASITPRIQFFDGFVPKGDQTYSGNALFKLGYSSTVTLTKGLAGALSMSGGLTVGQFTPYRSEVTVADAEVSGSVKNVKVVLNGFTHGFPDDMQVLLVGPKGDKVLLMANAGGSTAPAAAVNMTFSAPGTGIAKIPDNGPVETKTYLPSSWAGETYVFPPAPGEPLGPQPPFGDSLGVFVGSDLSKVRGTWRLYVADDSFGQVGSITSVDLIIETDVFVVAGNCTTRPIFTIAPAPKTTPEDTMVSQTIEVQDQNGGGTEPFTAAANLQVSVISSSDTTLIPTGNVVIETVSGTGNEAKRVVKVTPGANQPTGGADKAATITVRVTDGDTLYSEASFVVTVQPINDAPTITSIPNVNTPANTQVSVPFTVGDVETPVEQLVVFADVAASAPFIVELSGTGANRTLTVKPKTDQVGFGTVTVTVVDQGQVGGTTDAKTASTSFGVSIGTTSGAPVITYVTFGGTADVNTVLRNKSDNSIIGPLAVGTSVVDQRVGLIEDFGTKTFKIGVFDNLTAPDNLVVTAVSSNPGLFAAPSVSSTGAERTLTLTSSPNQASLINTPAVITVTVTDTDGLMGSSTFQIYVNPVPDAPTISFNDGSASPKSITINEDTAATILVRVDDPEDGPNLAFSALSSDPTIIPNANVTLTPPGPITPKTLAILPAPNANGGPVTITATVTDKDGLSASIQVLVTVSPVNDAPSFSKGADVEVVEDSGAKTVADWATNIADVDSPLATIALSATASVPALFADGPRFEAGTADSKRTLKFTPAANKFGSTTVTVIATDIGGAVSAAQTFTITIKPQNDAPFATLSIPNYTVDEDPGAAVPAPGTINADTKVITLPGVLTGINPGNAEEASQSVTPLVTANNNTGLFAIQPTLSLKSDDKTIANLSFKLADNKSGTAELKFKVQDNGGTADGGADISGEYIFVLTVTAEEDAPTVAGLPDVIEVAKNQTKNLVFTVNDVDRADQGLIEVEITGVATPLQSFTLAKNGGIRALTLVPVPDRPVSPATEEQVTLTFKIKDDTNAGLDVTKTVVYRVKAINTPPTISGLPTTTVHIKETELATVPFTVDDLENRTVAGLSLEQIKVTATADNKTVFPDANILLQTPVTGGARTLVLIPAQYKFGSNIVITVRAEDSDPDGAGPLVAAVTLATFKIEVEDVNQAPVISGGVFATTPAKAETFEDTNTVVTFKVTDVDELDVVTVTATAETAPGDPATYNVNLIDNIQVARSGSDVTLTINLKANESGLQRIKVVANDGRGLSDTKSFDFTVNPVNDDPVVTGWVDQATTENTNKDFSYTVSDVESTGDTKKLKIKYYYTKTNGEAISPDDALFVVDTDPATDGTQAMVPGAVVEKVSGSTIPLRIVPKSNRNGAGGLVVHVEDTGYTGKVGTLDVTLASKTTIRLLVVNIGAVNAAPTISAIADATVPEDTTTGAIIFTIDDNDTAISKLSVTAVSDNAGVVAQTGITLSGLGNSRTIQIQPVANASGVANITVTVNDNNDFDPKSAQRTFKVTVNSVNDAPQFVDLAGSGLITGTGPNDPAIEVKNNETLTRTVKFADVDNAITSVLIYGANSSLPQVIPIQNIQFNQTDVAGTVEMKIRPAANQVGVVTVTIGLTDGAAPSPTLHSFKVNVTSGGGPLGEVPVVTPSTNYISFSESQAISPIIRFTTTDADDAATSLVVTAQSSNQTLVKDVNIFIGSDVSGVNRTMSLLIEAGQSGQTVITIRARDPKNNVTSATITVEVIPVNAAPTISGLPAAQTINEDGIAGPLAFTVGDRETDPGLLKVTGSSGNAALVPAENVVFGGSGASRTILVKPLDNQFGTATITVRVEDDSGLFATATMVLTVTSVNDLPTINPATLPDRVIKDGEVATVNITIDDVETPAGSLNLTGASSNPTLVPNANVTFSGTGNVRTVRVTPTPGLSGVTTITVTVTDGSGGSTSKTFKVTVEGMNRDDLDSDGLSDLVFQHRDGFMAAWFMNNDIRKSAAFFNPNNPGSPDWRIAGNADMNADGKTDLVFQYLDGSLAVWYMDGINQIGSSLLNPSTAGSPSWRVVAVADFNADGKEDLLFENADLGGTLAIWYMDGINRTGSALVNPQAPGAGWKVVGAADITGLGLGGPDGKTDIIYQSTDGTIAVWAMDGANRIDTDVLNPSGAGASWYVAAVANLEPANPTNPAASQADIILQNADGTLQVWYLRGLNAPIRRLLTPSNAGDGWNVVAPK